MSPITTHLKSMLNIRHFKHNYSTRPSNISALAPLRAISKSAPLQSHNFYYSTCKLYVLPSVNIFE